MPRQDDLSRPLSHDDWEGLASLLDGPGGPTLDFCVGFLTAVATAPTPIPPSEWLPVVIGDRVLDGPEDPQIGLVLRMFNTISAGLPAKDVYRPSADQVSEVEDWCSGYMHGVDLDHAWIDNFDGMEPVFPIAVLAGEHPVNDPEDEDRIEDEDGWKQKAREQLGSLVLDAFHNLAPVRRATAGGAGGWMRDGPKVGRNDPCTCGSGKKYKKCCLGTSH